MSVIQTEKGMPALLIRKISGHATENAFLKYTKLTHPAIADRKKPLTRKLIR
jgi:hypothetical protein